MNIQGNTRKYEVMRGKYEEKARKWEENTRNTRKCEERGSKKTILAMDL